MSLGGFVSVIVADRNRPRIRMQGILTSADLMRRPPPVFGRASRTIPGTLIILFGLRRPKHNTLYYVFYPP